MNAIVERQRVNDEKDNLKHAIYITELFRSYKDIDNKLMSEGYELISEYMEGIDKGDRGEVISLFFQLCNALDIPWTKEEISR